MKLPGRRATRLLTLRSALLIGFGAGCSPAKPPAPPEPPPAPAVVLAPEPGAGLPPVPAPEAPPAAPPAPEPPPEFRFTPDLSGPAVAKVVTPAVPLKLPTERKAAEPQPQPRPVPARYLDPDPSSRTVHALPPVLPVKAPPAKPAPPAEKLPLAFGAGTERERVALPVAAVATARARDAGVPPPAPLLGRQAPDRTPFDDPTGEVGNAAVVANAVPVPLGVSEFLKVAVPDPFELGTQVKPSVPPAAEPSARPVEVSPARVK